MNNSQAAPILSRVRSWQLVGLGISGWVALYSAAVAMTLAGLESRRFQKPAASPADPLEWTGAISTEQLNETLAQALAQQEMRIEKPHPTEKQLGFGVRAINAGRTLVYETERWQEPVIDLEHTAATDENRKKVYADQAIIVGAGQPDKAARTFVTTHPAIKFLIGEELKELFPAKTPSGKNT
jgi:hypothetical protein